MSEHVCVGSGYSVGIGQVAELPVVMALCEGFVSKHTIVRFLSCLLVGGIQCVVCNCMKVVLAMCAGLSTGDTVASML